MVSTARRANSILVLACAALWTLPACQDDDDTPAVPEAVVWERDGYFQFGDAEQMNSHSTGDKLYFQGNLLTVQKPSESDDSAQYKRVTYNVGSNHDYDLRKLPLSDDIIVTYGVAGGLKFYAADNPVRSRSAIGLSLPAHDADFLSFEFNSYWLGECMALSDDGYALVPYNVFSDLPATEARRELRLALVTIPIDTSYVYGTQLGEPSVKIVRLDQDVYRTLLGPHVVQGGFVASDQLGVYRIANDGTVARVLDKPIDKFVDGGNFVYGIGDRRPGDGNSAADIYVSADHGRSWRQVAEYDRPLIFLNYDEVDGRVVGYRLNELFTFDFDSATGFALDNTGLDGAAITSVTAHDSVAYVTTLSGVFTKPLENLWDERVTK